MMKSFWATLSILLLFSCKSYRIKNVYFKSETIIVNSKIVRIDSTDNDYVYFLKNDTLMAYFTKPKTCFQNFQTAIDTTRNYQLKVKTDATYNYDSKTRDMYYFLDKTSNTFNYDDYKLILLDSPDICRKTVECKENIEFKKEFFSHIKVIDSNQSNVQNKNLNNSLLFVSKYAHVSYESTLNYARTYPYGIYEQDRIGWLKWYETNKCTNIQFKIM